MSQDIQAFEEETQPKPFLQSVGYAGGTFAGIGIIDAAAHLGPTGLVFAAIGSVIAYKHGADIRASVVHRYTNLDPKSKAAIRFVAARFGHDISVDEEAIEESHAQPKDDTRRVVDESEDEEYIWDGDDEIIPVTTPGHTGGLFTFSHVLDTGFIPTLKKIYVGSTEEGVPLFVEAKDLCHVALGGNTGGGKTSLIRMLMAQLCKAGATVYLLNPHYTVYDREHDEDWTPFTPYLKEDPMMCSEYDKIEYYLEQLAGPVLRKRIDLVKAGQLPGKPCFLIIDELPAIVKECAKNVPGFMEKLLREGRKYGIFLIVGSQDFLVKTIGTEGGAVRQCFRTGYYVGGDPTTARNLLEQGIAIPETRLGKGIAMLRCAATKKTIIAKIPYVDNASLYRLLGPSTFFQAPPSHKSVQPVQVLPDLSEVFEEESHLSMHDLCEAVIQMAEMHYKNGEIIRLLEISGGEYRAAIDYIRSHRSEFPAVGGSAEKTPSRPNLSVVHREDQELPGTSDASRDMAVNEPTEQAGVTSDRFVPREDDLLLSEVQGRLLEVWYQVNHNVEESLKQIRNERGQGLGSRYNRHASYLLEQAGLKKRRA
jgi:hypothetical protein